MTIKLDIGKTKEREQTMKNTLKTYFLTYYNILENYHILLLFNVKITLYIFNNF